MSGLMRKTSSIIVVAILAIFTLVALFTANRIPVFEAADEAAHFLYVHHLLEEQSLPVIPSREEITQIAASGDVVGQWSIESHQPPLYYALGAVLVSFTARDDVEDYLRPNELIFTRGIPDNNANQWLHSPKATGDTDSAHRILRAYSLVLTLVSLWLIYQTVWLAFGQRSIALGALLLTASIPTLSSIGISINNDNLVILLYSAGVYLSVSAWRYGLNRPTQFFIALVLALIALTKITGVSLFGVVFIALMLGAYRGHFTWRKAIETFAFALILTAILAGWWYLRNLQLYGDPLALDATRGLWGREFANANESGDVLAEMNRVWRSFWMMTGHLHFPVYGADWLYIYTAITTFGALIGLPVVLWQARKNIRRLDAVLLLALVALVLIAMLIVGTLGVDISYGRLLFPALVGFSALLIMGWRVWLGRFAPLLIMPIFIMALMAPVKYLPDAYPPLTPVDNVPDNAIPVNVSVDDLTIVAYEPKTGTVTPDEFMRFDLYLRGAHPDNPALFATAIDPITGDALGNLAQYPGTVPTDSYVEGQLYHTVLRVPVDELDEALSPRLLSIQLGWQTILDLDNLPMTDANGNPVEALLLNGATLVDDRYTAPNIDNQRAVIFGDMIRLDGYSLEQSDAQIDLTLQWQAVNAVDDDYVLTVQLLNADGELITQADGDILGYPTGAWRVSAPAVNDQRLLTLPDDLPDGDYQILLGWYRLEDFARLSVADASALNDLYPLATITHASID